MKFIFNLAIGLKRKVLSFVSSFVIKKEDVSGKKCEMPIKKEQRGEFYSLRYDFSAPINKDEISSKVFRDLIQLSKKLYSSSVQITQQEWDAFIDVIYEILLLKGYEKELYWLLSAIISYILKLYTVDECKVFTFRHILKNIDVALFVCGRNIKGCNFSREECVGVKQDIIDYSQQSKIIDFTEYYEDITTKEETIYQKSLCKVYMFSDYYNAKK